MTTATLKLLTMPECVAAKAGTPSPWRDAAVHALDAVWGRDDVHCVLCGEPIGRVASYAAVLMPTEDCWLGWCLTAGICLPCGVKQTRDFLHRHLLHTAMLTLGEVGGSA